MRDFRDNFTAEMLHEDHNLSGQIIAQYETIISVILIAVIPLISLIRNHFAAIQLTFIISLIGSIINLIGLYLFQCSFISGSTFILITGFGLYGGYILINISIMNRIVAYRKNPGNCGFLMYSADASGYLTSIAILCLALFGTKDAIKWFNVYETLIAVGSTAIFFISTYPIIKGLYPTKLTLKSNE
jgi:Co/Zn/Cd efflux system component